MQNSLVHHRKKTSFLVILMSNKEVVKRRSNNNRDSATEKFKTLKMKVIDLNNGLFFLHSLTLNYFKRNW